MPDLVTILRGISETYDISPLLRYMLPHLVVSIINHVTGVWLYVLCPNTCFLLLDSLKIGTTLMFMSKIFKVFANRLFLCNLFIFLM